MKYQVGDDVAVDFMGRIIRIEVDIEGKIVYTIRGNAGTYCTVTENCIRPLPLPTESNADKIKQEVKFG